MPQRVLQSPEMPPHTGRHRNELSAKRAQMCRVQVRGGALRDEQEERGRDGKDGGRGPSEGCERAREETTQPEERCLSGKEESEVRRVQ